jgi:DNA-binding IclR family transcriptional regulator
VRTSEAAQRVAQALELMGAEPSGLGVREMARRLDVHPSTASRLLASLAFTGLIERDEGGSYRLGARFVGLAAGAVTRLPVVSQARPELEALAAVASETVNLAVLDGTHVIYVDQVMPAQSVVMASWVGRRSPAHASSSGKVLLAFGDARVRERLLRDRLETLTPRTVTDPRRLRRVLEETRRRGYVVSDGELEVGLVTIAAPVLVDGSAVAAVSLSGPVFRLPTSDRPRLARLLVDAAAAAGHRMAGHTRGLSR